MNTMISSSETFDAVVYKLPKKAKVKTAAPGSESYETWLSQAKTPEEWIDICFRSESGIWGNISEKLWQAGIEKFGNDHVYLEALGCFYYRQQKPHKSLEALRPLLRQKPREFTIKVAMSAAFHLQQPRLVWEYFLLLTPSQRNQLEHDLLNRAASAAISLERYQEAEKIYLHLRERSGVPPLPTLEDSLMDEFKSRENLNQFLKEMQSKTSKPESRAALPITDIITYSSALMFHGNYDDALNLLVSVRQERFS